MGTKNLCPRCGLDLENSASPGELQDLNVWELYAPMAALIGGCISSVLIVVLAG